MTAVCALSACGDPLANVDKLSDVTLAETDPVRGALASPEEIARPEGGLLSGLFRRDPSTPSAETDPVAAATASAEASLDGTGTEPATVTASIPADPGAATDSAVPVDAQTVSEVSEDVVLARVEPAKRRGLFGRLADRAAAAAPKDPITVSAPVAATSETVETAEPVPEIAAGEAVAPAVADPITVAVEEPKRQGILGGLFGGARSEPAATDAPSPPVEVASVEPLAPEPAPQARVKPTRSGGLFGRRAAKVERRDGPDKADVPYGTVLSFGAIARVCDAKGQPMGRQIEKAGKGRGYALYDSEPGSTGPRTFYVTGFDDGCPRQFTAALALFGAPSLHETLRYGRPSDKYPYSTTDVAYEKVKSAVCKVPRRKPCGGQITTLEKDTVFISTYERFTNNGRWADILVHDGTVLAAALKDP